MQSAETIKKFIAAEADVAPTPTVRKIGVGDLMDALRKGLEDFLAKPSHYVFLALIYPIVGLIAATAVSGGSLLPLLYPMAAGFTLVGPVAALAFYALSHRREQGLDASWWTALSDIRPGALRSIALLGAFLLAIFALWLLVAEWLYLLTLGPADPAGPVDLLTQVFSSPEGYQLLLIGNAVGFVFAAVVLMLTVVSFPMLLDRPVSAWTAVRTSIQAVLENKVTMAIWGLIIAASLCIGSLPAFVGLAVVLPVLGHASWHLYRKVVAPD